MQKPFRNRSCGVREPFLLCHTSLSGSRKESLTCFRVGTKMGSMADAANAPEKKTEVSETLNQGAASVSGVRTRAGDLAGCGASSQSQGSDGGEG